MLPLRFCHGPFVRMASGPRWSNAPRVITTWSQPNRSTLTAWKAPATRLYSSTTPPTPPNEEKKPEKLGIMGMFRQYGMPFLVWETVAWAGTFVVVYAGVSAYGGYDAVVPALKQMGIDQYIHVDSLDPTYGNIAIAVAINEALEIVRFPFVVSTTPRVANWWRSRRK